jgi:excisionase family DNA binding protein
MNAFTTKAAFIPMASPIAKKEILTIKELAEHLKVNERTIYRLAGAGRIPAFKVGGSWRFLLPDIEAWIYSQSTLQTCAKSIERGQPDSAAEPDARAVSRLDNENAVVRRARMGAVTK